MIKYQLSCNHDHSFEGWFPSSSGFDEQAAAGLVECPHCGSVEVRRALMAPNLSSPKTRKSGRPTENSATAFADSAPQAMPNSGQSPGQGPAQGLPPAAVEKMHELMAEMRQLQSKIKSECRDVGTEFAEEARKIHYGEAEAEGIYGTTTQEEREALDEEGIDVVDIPWLPSEN